MKTGWMIRLFSAGVLLWAVGALAQEPRRGEGGTPPPPEGRRGGGDREQFRDQFKQQWGERLERFKAENPEEYQRLMQLKENDPEAFKKELRELAAKRMGMRGEPGGMQPGPGMPPGPEEQKCMELGRSYQEAKTPEDKERIKGEIRSAVKEAFEKRLQMQKERVEKMEQEIGRIRESIKSREASRDKICDARVDELTRDPDLRW